MLQLIYISSAVGAPVTSDILAVSCRNNGRDDVTGLLYADGKRFLQALEGPDAAVETAYARIARDPRHRAVVILSRRVIERREFGQWGMAERRPGEDGNAFVARVHALIAGLAPNARATFDGLVRLRHAA